LNEITANDDNYYSENFSKTFFSVENARKIGAIREIIELISDNEIERNALLCSLVYAADKVANTCGVYDAYRKKLDKQQKICLLIPKISYSKNRKNKIYNEDANMLIKKINSDVLYIDPPYNSRQYSDSYHLLENLVSWKKPELKGIAKKMDRSHLKSDYCTKAAPSAFADLIYNANCKHILMSYNNTGNSKCERSNSKISDDEIMETLSKKGKVKIYEQNYKTYTAKKNKNSKNSERIFYCEVK
jgi:adenine-specific DNA-methyltransferase